MPNPDAKASRATTATSVAEYLAGAPEKPRALLTRLRKTIKAAAPTATESISYGMPTFKHKGKRLAYFAYWKDHCALYGLGGRTIRFTAEEPLSEQMLTRMIKARLAEIERAATS
jgi:uncharacterized protein YdhG (YjbR/CyaY superfamily)